MRHKIFHVLFFILSFGLASAAAQTPAPKSISKGVVNGSAISLPTPAYPPAAKAVNAGGAVSVQVTIDEEGNVISARAVSGHPLLQAAAVQAARAAKFRPTLLQGQPVKVTGTIVYNFVAGMTFTQIGYELGFAEKSMTLKNAVANSISASLPAEWKEEKENLKALGAYVKDQNAEENKVQTKPDVSALSSSISDAPTEPKEKPVVSGGMTTYRQGQNLDDKSVDILKDIQSKMENRLSANEKMLWAFRLGGILGKIHAEIESQDKTLENVAELDQLNAAAPAGIPAEILLKVKEISDASRQTAADNERKEKISTLSEGLRNQRIY